MHAKLYYALFLKNIVKAIVGFTALAMLLLITNYSLTTREHSSSLQVTHTKHVQHFGVNTSTNYCLQHTQSPFIRLFFEYFCIYPSYDTLYLTQNYIFCFFISINITNIFSFFIIICIPISVIFCILRELLYYAYRIILLLMTLAPYFTVRSLTLTLCASLAYLYGARVVGSAVGTIRVYPPSKIITNIIGIVYNPKCDAMILLRVCVIANKHNSFYQAYLQAPYVVVLAVILMSDCALFCMNENTRIPICNWMDVLLLKIKYMESSIVFRIDFQVSYFWILNICNG